jgi:uncharacterized membrane protein
MNDTSLHFYPRNDDVGIINNINISITDNNETPIQYVWQHIRIIVRNINDPPNVRILSPFDGAEFFSDENITFNCAASDIDLLIPAPTEKLTFKWLTNNTNHSSLGTAQHLRNLTLTPGYYNVSVLVTDSGGKSAIDFVTITIKEQPSDFNVESRSEQAWWGWVIWLIIIIIIIIIILLFLFLRRSRKREDEVQPAVLVDGQVLLPDGMYQPPGGVLSAVPTVDQIGAPITTPVISQVPTQAGAKIQPTPTSAPSAQLPPAQSQVPVATPIAQGEEMTPQEKLRLLEERLIRGEISEETYLNLKDRIEFDIRQTGPAPQLPPATASVPIAQPVTTEPTSPTLSSSSSDLEPGLGISPIEDTSTLVKSESIVAIPENIEPEHQIPKDQLPLEITDPPLPADLPSEAYQGQQQTDLPQSTTTAQTVSPTPTQIPSPTPKTSAIQPEPQPQVQTQTSPTTIPQPQTQQQPSQKPKSENSEKQQ